MSKKTSTPMTRDAVRRIAASTAKKNGGQIPRGSFASTADASVQRREAAKTRPQPKKP